MFVNNKYLSWYISIIASAQSRELPSSVYVERHHIIPKSLGGLDISWNIVKLTGKEHFIVHKLLTKFTTGPARYKMTHALWRMIGRKDKRDRHKVSASEYQRIKSLNAQAMSEAKKGKRYPAQLEAAAKRRGIPAHNKGKSMQEDQKKKISKSRLEKFKSIPSGQKLNLTDEQLAKRKSRLAQFAGQLKGCSFPKYRYVIQHKDLDQVHETTHLKKWLRSQGITDPRFYSGSSGWFIAEKYNLKTGQRLI